MYIIVVGGGKVGYYLTKALLLEGHEVLCIERNPEKCATMADELGNVVTPGDGCEARTMEEAGVARAELVIAVTGDDEDNLVACQMAKRKFGVQKTIARINNPKNEGIFKKLGIDVTVSSTNVILEHIQQELPTHPPLHLVTMRNRGLELVDVKIPPNAQVVGKRIRDITFPSESILSLVIKKELGPQIPNGDTVLDAEDEILAVTKVEKEEELRALLTGV